VIAGTTVAETSVAGWRALTLENDALSVTVLPDKGAEIHALVDRETETNVLFEAPWGLQPPGSPPRRGSGRLEFLWNYGGGWQELFPSANDPCTYRGEPIPFHGEVALLPWAAEAGEGRLRLSVRCRRTPFRLERTMELEESCLVLEERVTNEGDEAAHFVWGHHCVVGPPFLEPGCRLHAPVRTIVTTPEPWEETARLLPGQESRWPRARGRDGGTVDLGVVPGTEAGSHDDVYLTGLDAGWVAVENPTTGLSFGLEFDHRLFRWLISWQPYGGARAEPLAGSYALGIEPWTTSLDLEHAVAAGEAVEVAPGGRFETTVRARLAREATWPS
jgi:galactose mutarotase-like enzyme